MSDAGFTFDGIDPGDAGYGQVKLTRRRIGFIPLPRRRMVSPGPRPGSWDFGSELGERAIDLELITMPTIVDSGASYSVDRAIRELASVFDPTKNVDGDRGFKKLVFDADPDKYWLAKLVDGPQPDLRPGFATLRLGLRCADPFLYAEDETTHNGVPITVTLLGNYWVEPTLALTCPGSYTGNITVEDDYAAIFTWSGSVIAADVLTIDSRTMRVYKNGVLAMSGVVGGSIWPRLSPGASTTLVVGGIAPSAASLVYRDRWL